MKESAYKGLVRLVLEYGSSVWDPLGRTGKGPESFGKVCDWKLCFFCFFFCFFFVFFFFFVFVFFNWEHDWHFRSIEMGIS